MNLEVTITSTVSKVHSAWNILNYLINRLETSWLFVYFASSVISNSSLVSTWWSFTKNTQMYLVVKISGQRLKIEFLISVISKMYWTREIPFAYLPNVPKRLVLYFFFRCIRFWCCFDINNDYLYRNGQ